MLTTSPYREKMFFFFFFFSLGAISSGAQGSLLAEEGFRTILYYISLSSMSWHRARQAPKPQYNLLTLRGKTLNHEYSESLTFLVFIKFKCFSSSLCLLSPSLQLYYSGRMSNYYSCDFPLSGIPVYFYPQYLFYIVTLALVSSPKQADIGY